MTSKKTIMLILGISFLLSCTYGGGNMKVNVLNPAAPLYDEGMDAYNSGDYSRAITAFTDVVNYYPNNGLADDALFMLARTYENTKDYLNALRYYKLFLARYPNHKWAPRAQKSLKILSNKIEGEGS